MTDPLKGLARAMCDHFTEEEIKTIHKYLRYTSAMYEAVSRNPRICPGDATEYGRVSSTLFAQAEKAQEALNALTHAGMNRDDKEKRDA